MEIEKWVNETRGWERVKPLNFLDGFRLGWQAARAARWSVVGAIPGSMIREDASGQIYMVPPDPSDPRERP